MNTILFEEHARSKTTGACSVLEFTVLYCTVAHVQNQYQTNITYFIKSISYTPKNGSTKQ